MMKTLSIVAITAFAFLGLANFASAQGGFQVSSMTFKNNKYLPLSAIDNQAFYNAPTFTIGNACTPNFKAVTGKKSPQLSWTNVPLGTRSFVVIARDTTSMVNAVHWGMYNIPRTTTSLPENAGAADTTDPALLATIGLQVKNYSGRLGYIGPCPPPNDERGDPHTYEFRVYALDQELNQVDVPLNSDAAALLSALDVAGSKGHVLDSASITGFWSATNPPPTAPTP